MAVKSLLGFGFLLTCCLLEVSSRPNNEFDTEWIYSQRSNPSNDKPDVYRYDGEKFVEGDPMDNTYVLHLQPEALAVSGSGGLAVANPESHVAIRRNESGTVFHMPKATAVVGPGGIAHAQASIQYLPFYGGAKGQYLEVKKDNRGTVLSEKIVAEESISSENVIKNSNDNLLSRVLAANLQNLKTLSTSLIRLNNLGRKVGSLSMSDKTRFKNQLSSLAEAASNTIKLIEEVGDDVSVLFKSNATLRRYDDADEEDVGEEGIAIENPEEPDNTWDNGGTIAEAKPYGLAVIGENGLAASRPMATAVAERGVAVAKPIATAIAGIDPIALGINFPVNQYSRAKGRIY
ncbi:uncharacterized protein [Epargyreus clarus]|uniref:uncharacterized protein isoform X2 n=1 Tax=Epargyreus clarus TaxID=520877 RepID=UPI003C2ECEEC